LDFHLDNIIYILRASEVATTPSVMVSGSCANTGFHSVKRYETFYFYENNPKIDKIIEFAQLVRANDCATS
jgi:hypothetical protein